MKEYFKSIFFLYVASQYGVILLKFFVMKSDNNILGVLLMLLFHSIYFVIDFLSNVEIIDCNPYIIATNQLILIILTVISSVL